MNKKQKITIAVLLVVAALLGVGISVRDRSSAPMAADTSASVVLAPAGSQASVDNIDTPVAPAKPAYAAALDQLTVAEKEAKLMSLNLSSASPESTKNEYFYLANALAKTAPVLEISACKPTPLVYEISEASFSVKNTGSKEMELNFGGAKNYSIAPGKTVLIKDALTRGVGFYGYGCTGKQDGPAGIVFLAFLPQ